MIRKGYFKIIDTKLKISLSIALGKAEGPRRDCRRAEMVLGPFSETKGPPHAGAKPC